MLRLLPFLLFFMDDGKSVQSVTIDDLAAIHVTSIAEHHNETLFLTIPPINGAPSPAEIWHVRNTDMSLSKLVDGRFGGTILQVAWVGGGFIIRNYEQKIIRLDSDLKFMEMVTGNSFFKLDTNSGDITFLSPYKNGQTLITLRKNGEYFLGLFDGENFHIVTAYQPKDGISVKWLYTDHQTFMIEIESGKISRTGQDFLPNHTIFPARSLVPKQAHSQKQTGLYSAYGLSPYHPAYTCILVQDSFFTLLNLKRIDTDGTVLKIPTREYISFNRQGRMKAPVDTLVIAKNQSTSLVFNREDGIFEFRPVL